MAAVGVLCALSPALSGPANQMSICELAARQKRVEAILFRADQIQPRRRNSPTRYLNISDEEVREIQSAASEVVGKVVVTIGPVVVGCPCEDGTSCTDQVWILAHLPKETVGLLLSKIGGHWDIGTVQRWWLRDFELRSRDHCSSTAECDALEYARRKHMDDFPMCGINEEKLSKEISELTARCNKK